MSFQNGHFGANSAATVYPARSEVRLHGANGYGSTDTKIPRYSTVDLNTGTAITFSDSATEGTKFTINVSGYYSLAMSQDRNSGEAVAGFSLNASAGQRTTTLYSVAAPTRLIHHFEGSTSSFNLAHAAWTGYLAAGDVVRPHSNGAASSDSTYCQCSIVFLGPAAS